MNKPDTSRYPDRLSIAFATRYPNAITAKRLIEALWMGWKAEQATSSTSQSSTSAAGNSQSVSRPSRQKPLFPLD